MGDFTTAHKNDQLLCIFALSQRERPKTMTTTKAHHANGVLQMIRGGAKYTH